MADACDPVASMGDLEARKLFQAEEYHDVCEDAQLCLLVFYLRGCRGLQVPPLLEGISRSSSLLRGKYQKLLRFCSFLTILGILQNTFRP